jgi:hypothetical protein
LDPADARARFRQLSWRTVAGFQSQQAKEIEAADLRLSASAFVARGSLDARGQHRPRSGATAAPAGSGLRNQKVKVKTLPFGDENVAPMIPVSGSEAALTLPSSPPELKLWEPCRVRFWGGSAPSTKIVIVSMAVF